MEKQYLVKMKPGFLEVLNADIAISELNQILEVFVIPDLDLSFIQPSTAAQYEQLPKLKRRRKLC